MPHVLILGAGISGLTVAYRLQQALPAVDITILESRDRAGGTIDTERRDGFQIEIGPNGFLGTKPTTLQLCHELGLGDHLIAASEVSAKNRYLFLGGRLKPLPGGFLSFLQSDLLSWRGKLALVMERFRPPRLEASDESVYDFAVRRAGREAAEVFADALVTGIHAGDPRLLSIRAAFPRLAALEREFGSVIKGLTRRKVAGPLRVPSPSHRPNTLWSFPAGLSVLIEALTAHLKRQPVFGAQVHHVAKMPDNARPQWTATSATGATWTADAVVLACPAYVQSALLADLDSELADQIGRIAYNRVAVVALGYRRADVPRGLDGFGFIAPQRTRRDLLGVQWCSSIFPGRAPEGMVLMRAICGGWHRAEVAAWDDARLLAAMRAELQLSMGIRGAPIVHHIARWDRAIPQYHLGHLERVAWIETRAALHPGLFLTGNAYHGVAMNDCTEQGAATAWKVANYLQTLGANNSLPPHAVVW